MTMILLVLLELAGFSRVALHTLFAGLVTSQLLMRGYFHGAMEHLGMLDSASGEVVAGHSTHEVGSVLGWAVFGLSLAANAISVMHEE